jgi:hypothetical protein
MLYQHLIEHCVVKTLKVTLSTTLSLIHGAMKKDLPLNGSDKNSRRGRLKNV